MGSLSLGFAADGYALGVIDTPSTRARMTDRTRDAVGWTNQRAGTYPCVRERRSAKCARLCADTPTGEGESLWALPCMSRSRNCWMPTGGRRTILSVGQIYLYDNPLLREPLARDHIKPRLLGHWGTTPGLNFIYAHLNRVIRARDLDMIFITGPGHGGPALVANAYLEGTYSEVYPNISQDEAGLKRLFTQFSFPGGIPSHVAPETPGSIHEGGELGYALSHAYGAAFDNPGPDRRLRHRRRRGRDRADGDQLALEQVSEPADRRRGAADPAPERLQDRQSDRARPHQPRGTRPAVPRLRLHTAFRRGRRSAGDARADGRDARRRRLRNRGDQGRGGPRRQ